MPVLANPRWEKFVQALFEGKPASTAFVEAGYTPNEGNAIRLKGNEKVKARLIELQMAAAKKSGVTVESLLDELEHARIRADSLNQLSASVKAIGEKARISGLLVTKIEVAGPGEFDDIDTVEELAETLLQHSIKGEGVNLTAEDREAFCRLFTRTLAEISDFINALKAKPVTAIAPPPRRGLAAPPAVKGSTNGSAGA